MSTLVEWSRWPLLPEDPDPVDPRVAFLPGKADSWKFWWGTSFLGHVAHAKCTRIRVVDGYAIMRLRWYDSIRREAVQKTVKWSMPDDLARCRLRLIDRVKIEMAAFKKDLFNDVKHHFN